MRRILIAAISIALMGVTSHDTMYKALEKAANNAIVEAGECGALTFKRTERFTASENEVTGNSISVSFKSLEPNIIEWQAPTERLNGSTDLMIGSYELTINCPSYNEVFLFSADIRTHEICGLSGICNFSLIAIDNVGVRSAAAVVTKDM